MENPYVNNYTRPAPDPQVVFSGPGYYTPKPRLHNNAVLALTTSIIGLIIVPLLPVGILYGVLGIRRLKNHPQPGYGAAVAGLCIASVGILVWLLILTATLIS